MRCRVARDACDVPRGSFPHIGSSLSLRVFARVEFPLSVNGKSSLVVGHCLSWDVCGSDSFYLCAAQIHFIPAELYAARIDLEAVQ